MSVATLPISLRSDGPAVAAALDQLHCRLAEISGSHAPQRVDPEVVPAPLIMELERRLALSVPERQAILLAAAAELFEPTSMLVAKIGSGPPTIGLTMRACDGLDWSSLRPDGALRRARLVSIGGGPDARFTERPVSVEEEVLHFLNGVVQLAPGLGALASAVPLRSGSTDEATLASIQALLEGGRSPFAAPAIAIDCDDPAEGVAHAVEGLRRAGLGAIVIPASSLPPTSSELAVLRDSWLRDSLLHNLGLVLVCNADGVPASVLQLQGWTGPLMFVGLNQKPGLLEVQRIEVRHDGTSRLTAWRSALPEPIGGLLHHDVDELAYRFRLPTPVIAALAREHGKAEGDQLWTAARTAARPRDLDLIERVEPIVTLDQVILPDDAKSTLGAIVSAARVHHRIIADWKGSAAGGRGLGIAALFCGESGTGKTMAAEAIARSLSLDLYRVEVSAVVSKYIGETEKNLRRIVKAAEAGGGVLLFDEADTLFGKRSEVRDSHDRYANMEVGYLLQLMEGFSGLAVLTSNFEEALDDAFKRRLRFIVSFPLPGFDERSQIWAGAFPPLLDVSGLDIGRLARLPLTGGIIRNIALGAAFRSAAGTDGRIVTMAQVLAAARAEYLKLGRPLAEIDTRDWS